ncbi:MAG: TonB-dependent receptor [Novosphingobium sp.]
MRRIGKLAFAGASLLAFATPLHAQDTAPQNTGANASADSDEIIVQARRRSESVQDVPLTVSAVTSEQLTKLNIRDFKDVASVVPGLSLKPAADGIAPSATLRGVNYDVNNSGSNATVQFYMNDAPIAAGFMLQSMFDVGQIEVLRGPQGTLRGIASPSGSITLTTRRPDMERFGGYAEGTVNTIGGYNINAALNVPLIKDVLAVRIAGIVNGDEGTRVRSINSSVEPSTRSWGERVTVKFTPTDTIDIIGSYQHMLVKSTFFDQVESANLALGLPVVGTLVQAESRLAVEDAPRSSRINYNIYNIQAEWRVAGQKLNYVGGWSDQDIVSQYQDDVGNVFDNTFPTALQNYGQSTHTQSQQQSHELRLSSDERLFGFLDYVVGGMINRQNAPTDLLFNTPIFTSAPPTGAGFYGFNVTPSQVRGRALERSIFGNLTAHIGDKTELSGGIRYIHFNNQSNLTGTSDFHATVYSASLKHRFNENIMAYASFGSSWRVGSGTNAIILAASGNFGYTDAALAAILQPTPETSKSYEAGVKTDWLDRRLRLNVTYFHQTFSNYIFSSPVVLFQAYDPTTLTYTPGLTRAGLSVGVPVKVDGVEAEFSFAPSRNFNIGGTVSYALGKISNGLVPCSGTALPTPPQQINFCPANQRSSLNSPFNATVQAEYNHDFAESLNGFLRGQLVYSGNSQVDPTNPYDDVAAYGLLNLFLGVRDRDGGWEVMAYGKNITDTTRVLTRDATAKLTTYATFTGGAALTSNYRGVTTTAPREFGLTARIAFGSR